VPAATGFAPLVTWRATVRLEGGVQNPPPRVQFLLSTRSNFRMTFSGAFQTGWNC